MTVTHNEEQSRFEAAVEDGLARLDYTRKDQVLVLRHTEVPPAAQGEGVGGDLVRFALDYARAEGMKIVPRCPFVAAWLRDHPGYDDVVQPTEG